ncbi:MAG: PqqD family protein [Gammaproteobacteria bacterium]|nr:PqqD family protein [Gammaproteobacteria bacterium]MCP5137966.1 PqqD family protein [Gammaproteobacteria bacterium]
MSGVLEWRLHPRVAWTPDADGRTGAVIDTWGAELSHCNETAWTALMALHDGTSLANLVSRLCAEYQVDEATSRADCQRLLQQLKAQGWIEAVSTESLE